MVSDFLMVFDTIMDFTIQKSNSFWPFENRIFRSNSTESNLSIELCRTLVNVNPDVSGNNQMSSGRFQILICTQRPTFEKLFTGAKVGRRRKAQMYRVYDLPKGIGCRTNYDIDPLSCFWDFKWKPEENFLETLVLIVFIFRRLRLK